MKKVLFLIVMAAMLFVGCSCFDSKPVEPKILGVTHILYDRGLTYVEIDSMRYPVNYVFSGEKDRRTGPIRINPAERMVVTVAEFTGGDSRGIRGTQFLLGEWDEERIEDLFHSNYTLPYLYAGCFFLLIFYYISKVIIADIRNSRTGRK